MFCLNAIYRTENKMYQPPMLISWFTDCIPSVSVRCITHKYNFISLIVQVHPYTNPIAPQPSPGISSFNNPDLPPQRFSPLVRPAPQAHTLPRALEQARAGG